MSPPPWLGRQFSTKGRVGRLGFWFGTCVSPLVFLTVVDLPFGVIALVSENVAPKVAGAAGFAAVIIGGGGALWIILATQIKRWHDRGKSGTWTLLNFVPYLGTLWVPIELGLLPGTPGPNAFGPVPAFPQASPPVPAPGAIDIDLAATMDRQGWSATTGHSPPPCLPASDGTGAAQRDEWATLQGRASPGGGDAPRRRTRRSRQAGRIRRPIGLPQAAQRHAAPGGGRRCSGY